MFVVGIKNEFVNIWVRPTRKYRLCSTTLNAKVKILRDLG